MKKSDEERIAFGECVSPLTTERCPVCVDICEASVCRRDYNKLVGIINDNPKDG